MWWWWWGWIALILVFLVLPWGYGWGRRGWGPPYPTYYRRRYQQGRGSAVAPESSDVAPGDPVPPNYQRTATLARPEAEHDIPGAAWWWLADLLWLAVLAAVAWAIYLWVT